MNFATDEIIFRATAVATLVESLPQGGTGADVEEAQAAIERLAAVPTEPGFVLYGVALLRYGGIAWFRRAYRMG
jgi:adenylate cyclase